MTAHKIAITAAAAVCAAAVLAAAPQIASAATCTVTKTHVVHRVVHKRLHRPVAVAAYREEAPRTVTRTVVETRYVREPAPVVVEPAPIYPEHVYYDEGYAPYPVYYHHYGYGPYYHHVGYGGPRIVVGFGHRHW